MDGLRVISPFAHKGILSAKGDYWKRSRRILTPAFGTLKLKVVRCNMPPADYIWLIYYSRWCPSFRNVLII